MGNLEREMLLGYLMNALEDDEIAHVEQELLRQPKFRTELAMLQKELSPLASIYEPVEPPRHLAKRTCDKIWAHVDRKERFGHFLDAAAIPEPIISMTIPSSPFKNEESTILHRSAVLEEILAVSPQSSSSMPTELLPIKHSEQKRLVRRTSRSGKTNISPNPSPAATDYPKKKLMKKSRWIDITIAVTVGILIAVIAFPVINYAKHRTERYFTWNAIHQINKSVDHYTQIQTGSGENMLAEPQPSAAVNLAQSDWQELKPTGLSAVLVSDAGNITENKMFDSAPIESYPHLLKTVSLNSTANSLTSSHSQGRDIVLGQANSNDSIFDPASEMILPLDPHEFDGQTLISNIGHVIPVSGGSTLQTAYGQNVLLQNGRIFVRILPIFAPSK